jgi:hypothetical protein
MAWHREIILLPEAQSDINEAYWWYEDKSVGLGEEFLSCTEAGGSKWVGHEKTPPA